MVFFALRSPLEMLIYDSVNSAFSGVASLKTLILYNFNT